jgi:Putative bacterial sensory transduction regulator
MVMASDPASLVGALQAAGYRAELGKEDSGLPMITSAASGSTFIIYFYGCTNNANCRSITFYAGYAKRDKVTPVWINDWNYRQRFARGYLNTKGDPRIEMDVVLDVGGISRALFGKCVDLWAQQQSQFEKELYAP